MATIRTEICHLAENQHGDTAAIRKPIRQGYFSAIQQERISVVALLGSSWPPGSCRYIHT